MSDQITTLGATGGIKPLLDRLMSSSSTHILVSNTKNVPHAFDVRRFLPEDFTPPSDVRSRFSSSKTLVFVFNVLLLH